MRRSGAAGRRGPVRSTDGAVGRSPMRGAPARILVRGMRVLGVGFLVFAVVGPAACTPDDQRTETLDVQGASTRAGLSEAVVEALDSGSAAYRERDYERALEHYTRATERAPEEASGWFGVYMVHQAAGDLEAADSALQRVRDLAPGASIVHPRPEDTLP